MAIPCAMLNDKATGSHQRMFSKTNIETPEDEALLPVLIVALTALSVAIYVLLVGPEAFYYESLGTLMLSPIIYVRILPAPLNEYLLYALAANPTGSLLLCLVPVLLLLLSVIAAINALRKRSVRAAVLCFTLCAVVFCTYHWVRPMGMTYVLQ